MFGPGEELFSARCCNVGVVAAGGWLGGREAGLATRDKLAARATVFSTVVIVVAAVGYRGLGSDTRDKRGWLGAVSNLGFFGSCGVGV